MKRIALIVTGTTLLVATCGIGSAAGKTVARPRVTVSPEQLVARAEHVARPRVTVSPEQLVARAEHVARPGSRCRRSRRSRGPSTSRGH
jgi:hypothetical protein